LYLLAIYSLPTFLTLNPAYAPAAWQIYEEITMKMKAKLIAALLVAALTPFGALSTTHVYASGAIAVDDAIGDTPGYGVATGEDTQAEAARAALKKCKKVGNSDCRVVVKFEKCGAYAASKKYFGVGTGSTKAEARENALEECGNSACKVIVSDCE
jgi:Domain of unknown function (DUF4189)